jgi:hypothetical protein
MIRAHRADGSSSRTLIGRPFILPPVPLGADPRRGRFGSNVATTRGLGHRLARSLPDARAIADELTARSVKPNLGGSVCDPTDPVGRLLSNVLTMVAECEADLGADEDWEGMKVARAMRSAGASSPRSARSNSPPRALHGAEAHTISELEELFCVTRSTVLLGARPGPLPRRRPDSLKGTAAILWPLVAGGRSVR